MYFLSNNLKIVKLNLFFIKFMVPDIHNSSSHLNSVFGQILSDLRVNFDLNEIAIKSLLEKNIYLAFNKINEITSFVGKRYGLELQLHFPDSIKIHAFDEYGTENIGVIYDKFRKKFPIDRELIKEKILQMLESVSVTDAYMYEGKEGIRIVLKGGRIEIMPGSVHLWCKINPEITTLMNWFIKEVFYFEKKK